jgi:hypothetical protein
MSEITFPDSQSCGMQTCNVGPVCRARSGGILSLSCAASNRHCSLLSYSLPRAKVVRGSTRRRAARRAGLTARRGNQRPRMEAGSAGRPAPRQDARRGMRALRQRKRALRAPTLERVARPDALLGAEPPGVQQARVHVVQVERAALQARPPGARARAGTRAPRGAVPARRASAVSRRTSRRARRSRRESRGGTTGRSRAAVASSSFRWFGAKTA